MSLCKLDSNVQCAQASLAKDDVCADINLLFVNTSPAFCVKLHCGVCVVVCCFLIVLVLAKLTTPISGICRHSFYRTDNSCSHNFVFLLCCRQCLTSLLMYNYSCVMNSSFIHPVYFSFWPVFSAQFSKCVVML